MTKAKDVMGYCIYCKNVIYYNEAYTKGKDGKLYHPSCYVLLNDYTDEFSTSQTDEFGDEYNEIG